MRAFFAVAERPADVRLLWEPRGDWPTGLVEELCGELGLVHVVDPFVGPTVTPASTYFRLHGTTGARHVYSDAELERLVDWIPRGSGEPAYVLFNNLPRVGDARRFVDLVRGRSDLSVAPPAR
jgi:uncharacterized protein YecE (DUF72 family)